MPRKPRNELDGDCHHVIVKGHNSDAIVTSESDKGVLCTLLAAAFAAVSVEVWAWAVLTNHLHLFLKGSIGDVSLAMQRALGPYAQRRNAVLDRSGRMFNDRFWSRPVGDESYALALLVYVLLNPLKAGIVRTVDELLVYPWCSLNAMIAGAPAIIPVNASAGLDLFGSEPALCKASLVGCLEARVDEWRKDLLMESLEAIIRVVGARHGLPPDTLRDGTRGRWFVDARRDVVLEGRARGHSDEAIARALNMTRSGIWKLAGVRAA